MRGLGLQSFAVQGRVQPWTHGAVGEGEERDRSKCGSQGSRVVGVILRERDRDLDRERGARAERS